MKTKIYLIMAITLFTIPALAQDSIPNYHFERWDSSGKPAPFDWMEPSMWTSSNALTEFVGAGVTQTQYPGTTSNQVKIKTLNIFGSAVPGLLINGDFTLNLADTGKLPNLGGTPYTTVETKLYGLYNFVVTDTTDSASITVVFKRWDSANQQTEVVAMGNVHLPYAITGMNPFEVEIEQLTFSQPDSVVITIASTNENGFKHGGELILDFVSFDKPTSVKTIENNIAIALYPNPANDYVYVAADNAFAYTITDVAGKTVVKGEGETGGITVNTTELTPGVYFIRIYNENGNGVARFVKH